MKRALIGGGLLLGAALLAAPAEAQIAFAKGRVVDAQGQPVADATVTAVYLGEMPKTSTKKTNKKGEYVHPGLFSGRYRVTAEKEGYEPTIIEHDVTAGDPTELPDIVLQPKKAPEVQAREAAAKAPEEVKAKFAKAVDLTSQGQLVEAEALFKELLVILPDVAEIHQNLGYIYAQRKDWAKAEASYAKALELSPGNAASMTALAAVYEELGQHDKAVSMTQQAAAADPGNALAQFNRGVFLLNANQNAEAIAAFEAALALNPGLVESHFLLGTLFLGQNNVPKAIEHLEAYVAANPKNEQNVSTAKGLIAALSKKK
jgi:tetratricopeptide (TPR) repeat protein